MGRMLKLKAIMQRLRDGERLACIGRKGTCEMYYAFGLIHWHSFGSSANKATLRNLKWLMDVIFECDDYEVYTPAELKAKTGRDYFCLF